MVALYRPEVEVLRSEHHQGVGELREGVDLPVIEVRPALEVLRLRHLPKRI